MSFTDTLVNFFGRTTMDSIADYIRAESVETDHVIVDKEGSLMTMVRLHGMLGSPGEEEIVEMATKLRIAMSPFFSNIGHVMTLTFTRDPVASQRSMQRLIDRTDRIARNLNLDISDVLSERLNVLSKSVVEESTIMCLYSHSSLLSGEERKSDNETRKERTKTMTTNKRGQASGRSLDGVLAKHGAFVDMMTLRLRDTGQMVEVMNSKEAIEEMRFQISPSLRANVGGWEPIMPWVISEDEDASLQETKWSNLHLLPSHPDEMKGRDGSWMSVPSIDRQISPEDGSRLDSRRISIGDMAFESFDMSIPQQVLTGFNDLVSSMHKQMPFAPWRATFYFESGGVQTMRTKRIFLTFFKMMNSGNARVQEAIDRNAQLDGRNEVIIKFRACFSTWAPIDNLRELRKQSQIFQGAVRQWGITQIDGISGDPFATTIATMAGMTTSPTGPSGGGPMTEILALSPLARQASPWSTGSVIYKTESGKPWFFEPGSKMQDVWINIIMGAPGKGKSVQMNTINLGSILSSSTALGGGSMLPMIAIIDIGASSGGLVSLIKEALPENLQHLAVTRRLTMGASDSINVFDTHLGVRIPTTIDRSFLINLLSIICGDDSNAGKSIVPQMAAILVDEAYRQFMDDRTPKPYSPREELVVDNALADLGYETVFGTTWWKVVDFLISKKKFHEASLAQRHAVPNMSDLSGLIKSSTQIESIYAKVENSDTKETMDQTMTRKISETIRTFPILSGASRIDLGMARIISLDLMDVTSSSETPTARRQTAIMYMVARQICCREYFLNPEEFRKFGTAGVMNGDMVDYHVDRAEANKRVRKSICYDEYHRTKGVEEIRNQVITDGREGRKFGVVINVASQHATDFSKELVDFATGIFVCNADGSSLDHLDQSLKLTETDKNNIMNGLTGPGRNGAPFWVLLRVKGVRDTRQLLSLKLGPSELWAFSTDAYDAAVRDMLYKRITPKKARQVLSRKFPSGSVADEIRRRIMASEAAGERTGDELKKNIISGIVDDLESIYNRGDI